MANEHIEKDRAALGALMEKEVICWSDVQMNGKDADGQPCLKLTMPMDQQKKIYGGERCVISLEGADADSTNPRLRDLVGRNIPFVVTAIDEENGVLLCSRKKAQQKLKATMLQGFSSGQVYEGKVVGFSNYGGYIEVNGITGHIRNSDFSDDHSGIREYMSMGDTLEVRCKEVSPEGYIFWSAVSKRHRKKPLEHDFEVDSLVCGKVVRISDFKQGVGVFVNLQPGIDALCSMPRHVEVQEDARVVIKIESITPGRHATDAPRIRGRVIRNC